MSEATSNAPLTVVLVHGAFADSSSWDGVIERLQEQAAVMAAPQRPVAELAFTEPSGPPAWKSLPSWTVVATADKAAGTDVVRSVAERAGATTTEVDGSHVIMISRPDVVADVIRSAVAAVSRPGVATAG
jgi:pimeloyl-ACP methyl ester carboxylesterase